MRARLALGLTALALASMAPCRADPDPALDALDDCLGRLPAQQHSGREQLAALCPQLERTLKDAGVSDRLPDHWQSHLGPLGLRQLRALLQHYQEDPLSAAPSTAAVPAIVEALRAREPPRGWWQRFGEWLRQLLQHRAGDGPPLLQRLINALRGITNQRAQRWMLDGSLILVLLLVGLVVWRELRTAGLRLRTPQRSRAARAGLPAADAVEGAPLAALDRVALSERPALLLRLLVQLLRQRGRLPADRALTHRELIQRAGFEDAAQRQRFALVSLRAEQQLYGGSAAMASDPLELERVLSAGRELYSQLAAGSAAS